MQLPEYFFKVGIIAPVHGYKSADVLPYWFSLKKNLQLDWTHKPDARAAIRLAVKKELHGKVPFSALDELLKQVIEQAEGQNKDLKPEK